MNTRTIIYKPLLTVLLLFVAGQTLEAQEAFYIYRNDGNFDGFFYNEVKRIGVSKIDLEGVENSDYVVQEVETNDSLYRIPLASIDSVCFVQPEIKYNPQLRHMDQLGITPYVTSASLDNLSVTIQASIPQNLLPKVGDVIVGFDENVFGHDGFGGRVANIVQSGGAYTLTCSKLESWDDLFEQFITVEEIGLDANNQIVRRVAGCDSDGLPTSGSRRAEEFDHNLMLVNWAGRLQYTNESGNLSAGIDAVIKVMLRATYNISKKRMFFKALAQERLEAQPSFHATVNGEVKRTFNTPIAFPAIKFPAFLPLFETNPFPKGFVRANGSVDLSVTLPKVSLPLAQTIIIDSESDDVLTMKWGNANSKEDKSSLFSDNLIDWSADAAVTFNGYIQAGTMVQIEVATNRWIEDIFFASIGFDIYSGPKIEGNLSFSASGLMEDGAYGTMKDSEISIALLSIDTEANAKFMSMADGGVEHKMTFWNDTFKFFEYKWYLFPDFGNTQCSYDADKNRLTATVYPNRQCFWGLNVGIGVYDSENNRKIERFDTRTYGLFTNYFSSYNTVFGVSGLKKGTYRVVPLLKDKVFGCILPVFSKAKEVEIAPEQSQTYSITLRNPNLFFAKDGDIQLASFSTTAPALTDVKAVPKTTGENQWLTCEVGDFSEADNVFVTVTALPNTLETPREDDVHITATASDGTILEADIHCSQEGGGPVVVPPTLEVSKTMVTLPAVDASTDVYVTTNGTLSFSKTGGSWLSYEYHEDYGVLTITATDNTSNTVRKGSIQITASTPDGSISESISVEQEAAEQKYNGLWITMDLHEIESTSGNSLQHVMSFPTLHEHKLPAYCTASVFGNGDAHLRAVDSESSTFSQSFTFGGNTYQIEDETTVEWNITLNKHTNSSGDYVTGHVSQTETSVQTNTFTNSSTSTVTTIEFDLNDVPFYSDNTPVPGYTGYFMVPACEGYKVSKSIEQGRGITNSRGIEKYISGYSRTYTKDDETITYTIDPDYTSWELTVGLWEPWRGSITPYGKP